MAMCAAVAYLRAGGRFVERLERDHAARGAQLLAAQAEELSRSEARRVIHDEVITALRAIHTGMPAQTVSMACQSALSVLSTYRDTRTVTDLLNSASTARLGCGRDRQGAAFTQRCARRVPRVRARGHARSIDGGAAQRAAAQRKQPSQHRRRASGTKWTGHRHHRRRERASPGCWIHHSWRLWAGRVHLRTDVGCRRVSRDRRPRGGRHSGAPLGHPPSRSWHQRTRTPSATVAAAT